MSTSIREARAADAELYARWFRELALDEPVPPAARIAALLPRMLIVEREGAAAGFAVSDVEGEVGYLRQIVIAPEARRAGLGRALVRAAASALRARGARLMRLNVKADNAAAIALYEGEGLRVDFASAALWAGRGSWQRLPGSTTPLAVFEPPPSYELMLEARYHLGPGQLAHFRSRGYVLRAACRAGAREDVRGLMRFDPGFPGAFPFCADERAVARALLGELEATLPPEHARYGLVIERQPALVDALLEAGAALRFRMVQMRGAL